MPPDPLSAFREYMHLEKQRANGLTDAEYARWLELRSELDLVFGDFEVPNVSIRRATPRIWTELDVRFKDFDDIEKSLMKKISRGGLFVPAKSMLPIGADVELHIQIDDPPTSLCVSGEVVSHDIGPNVILERQGMGVRFKDLDAEQERIIDGLYERVVSRFLKSRR